ncbi:MAG TPA: hypothetical protein VFX58_10880 [Chitinophagaceae bacterium]|nr:hypothetical protein [Chitinophagaceae bacterium]
MKNLLIKKSRLLTIAVISLLFAANASSQAINWKSLDKKQRHLINVNAGAEYGFTIGAGYGYQLKTKMPIVLTIDHSFPAGDKISDDFKTRIGGIVRIYQVNDFQFSAKIQGVFRRYENQLARLVNFGSDMSAIAGYYKPKWFVAGEAGFDKAIVTHFKHSASYKQNFPEVIDGWYEPATGGNFYYGLQAGLSFGRNDIYVKGGKLLEQDFSTKPLLPFYLQVGYTIRL